jgi:hypothetical protein
MEIIKQPAELTLAHNQAWLIIETDNVVTPGPIANFTITTLTTRTLGTKLVFEFGDRVVELEVKSVADATIDKLGSIPNTGVASDIWNVCKDHPILSSFYEITYEVSGAITRFIARNSGAEYNIKPLITGKDQSGSNNSNYNWRSSSVTTSGSNDIITPQSAAIELLVEDVMGSGNYKPVITVNGVADKTNRIKWNLSGNLSSLFDSSFLPDLSSTAIRPIYDATRRFRIFFRGTGSITGQPNYYTAINSGVTKEDFAKFTNFETEVLQNKFLTWRSTVRSITRTQPEWLYFLQIVDRYEYYWNGTFDYLELNVKIYYDDDTTEILKPFNDNSTQKYGVLELPVSYEALGLAAKETTKTITHYECWVVHNKDENNQDPTIYEDVTEKVTYVLDEADYLDSYFVFRNSFDVLETIRTISIKSNQFTTKKDKISKILSEGYETSDGELEFYKSVFSDSYNVTLNAQNQKDFNYLKEVLLSKDAFLVVGDHLVKVMIESGKFDLNTDDDYTYLLPITFTFANVNSKFSAV